MCTALNAISKKVDERLSFAPRAHRRQVQHASVKWKGMRNVPSRDTQGESTPHWPMYPLSQSAFLTPSTEGEVQCPSTEMAGRRRSQ